MQVPTSAKTAKFAADQDIFDRANRRLARYNPGGRRYFLSAKGLDSATSSSPTTVGAGRPFSTTHSLLLSKHQTDFCMLNVEGEIFPLGGAMVLGRHRLCTHRLSSGSVSQFHTFLSPSARGIHIIDLGSTNGTRIDGRKIRSVLLDSPATLSLGATTLQIRASQDLRTLPHYRPLIPKAVSALRQGLSLWISGPTGTGKSTLLKAALNHLDFGQKLVHASSAELSRFQGSALHGYSQGAFTGAQRARHGLAHEAHNGVLLIDPADHLHPETQIALLRIIEERKVRPIGAEHTQDCNFKLALLGLDAPEKMLRDGRIREDFYYRACGLHIPLPTLAKSPELIDSWLENRETRQRWPIPTRQYLSHLLWPGNFHQLKYFCETLERQYPESITTQMVEQNYFSGSKKRSPQR